MWAVFRSCPNNLCYGFHFNSCPCLYILSPITFWSSTIYSDPFILSSIWLKIFPENGKNHPFWIDPWKKYRNKEAPNQNDLSKVPVTNLLHFMLKASVTSVHTEANAHSANWQLSVFVNDLAPRHIRSQQGKCVQQCRTILANTLNALGTYWNEYCILLFVCILYEK